MKKSQLRQIIRESINQLMTEQQMGNCTPSNPGCGADITDTSCCAGLGQTVSLGCTNPNAMNYYSSASVDDGSCIIPLAGCTAPLSQNYNPAATSDDGSCIACVENGCMDQNATNYSATADCQQDCITIYGAQTSAICNIHNLTSSLCTYPVAAGCAGWPAGGQHADHNSWLTYFTSLSNFSSSNPNQPCNMLCKKLTIWNNKLTNTNPDKTDIINRLTCKIGSGNDLIQTHNCSC